MATATTALVRATGNTGGAMMMMPTGTAMTMVSKLFIHNVYKFLKLK